jgi:murein DD-endopeptidase MepM/ murein hydrolase activator NlpD
LGQLAFAAPIVLLLFWSGGGPPASRPRDFTASPSTSEPLSFLGPTTAFLSKLPRPQYVWPVQGPISNTMSPRHPLGIDIGLASTPTAPIRAIASGTVVFAGGDPCCSYGFHVIVRHGDIEALYAHLSQMDVWEGQEIGQGAVLGIAGRTGLSTAEHLHFEIRKDGERVDPMLYLPPSCPSRDGPYPLYAMPSGDCEAVPTIEDLIRLANGS